MHEIRAENENYGYRPMTQALKKQGLVINHKKVLKLMRSHRLLVTNFARKTRKYNSYKGTVGRISGNRVKRRFKTSVPHQKITTDTTEFKYYENGKQCKAYLNPFLDMFNSEIISYTISKRPTGEAVLSALDTAVKVTNDCQFRRTFHSDQGWAYQMINYRKTLKSNKIYQSMSRKGNCLDNSIMENFFSILKQEIYYGRYFNSFEELETTIIEYIKYYNTKRIKKKLNWNSPISYRLLKQKLVV